MAANNYFTVVNFSGQALEVVINGVTVSLPEDGTAQPLNKFPQSGEQFEYHVEVKQGPKLGTVDKTLVVSGGTNSWSTFVFTNNGIMNQFASPNAQNLRV
ncbi:MAG TPA: hypothetical protein DCE41_33515 [Cytophagales bacterium]|nr:hypothetical protein [Cytophagales bacterium]HAA17354.1 hypothetical protein [Cytophagales bacterium]HAP59945.1 hypothetical protein [Cytophagales bacterium]